MRTLFFYACGIFRFVTVRVCEFLRNVNKYFYHFFINMTVEPCYIELAYIEIPIILKVHSCSQLSAVTINRLFIVKWETPMFIRPLAPTPDLNPVN